MGNSGNYRGDGDDTYIKGGTDDTKIGNVGDSLKVEATFNATSLKIKGDTDDTLIGNVGDRLKVDADFSFSSLYIKGNTDDTLIGNAGDRLKVDVDFSPGARVPIIPADNLTYRSKVLENGGSKSMSVDGSTTSVVFEHAPGAGEVDYIDGVTMLLYDAGNNALNTFGTLTALTNGLRIEMKIGGTVYEVTTVKDNAEFILTFTGAFGTQGNGGFAPDDAFWGKLDMNRNVTLTGDDGDYIRVIVQDNLTTIDTLQSAVLYWEIV